MTQEQELNVFSYWSLITDSGEYKLTDSEVDRLMDAESKGARLIRFDDFIVNIPFIREVRHKVYRKSLVAIAPEERKYFVTTERKLLS